MLLFLCPTLTPIPRNTSSRRRFFMTRKTTNRFRAARLNRFTMIVLATALLSVISGFTQSANAQTYRVPKNTPGFIKIATDLGAVDPSTVISVTVWLKMQNENKLDQLVKQQSQKGSPNYHKWIT